MDTLLDQYGCIRRLKVSEKNFIPINHCPQMALEDTLAQIVFFLIILVLTYVVYKINNWFTSLPGRTSSIMVSKVKICPYCANQNPEDAQYCDVSGTDLSNTRLTRLYGNQYYKQHIYENLFVRVSDQFKKNEFNDPRFMDMTDQEINLRLEEIWSQNQSLFEESEEHGLRKGLEDYIKSNQYQYLRRYSREN